MALTGLNHARRLVGLREIRDKEKLIQLFKDNAVKGDIAINPAETAWCGAFMALTQRLAGNKVTSPNPLLARGWLSYGTRVDPKDMQEGDILIFERGSNNWQGHVTYLAAPRKDNADTVLCIGGNQSDSVCLQEYSLDRLLGVRRP